MHNQNAPGHQALDENTRNAMLEVDLRGEPRFVITQAARVQHHPQQSKNPLDVRSHPGMKRRDAPTRRRLAVGLGVLLASAGCNCRGEADIGSPEHPVLFMLSPSHGAALQPPDLGRLGVLLGTSMGLSVEARVARTSIEAIDSLSGRTGDAGLLTEFEYLLARQEYQADAVLQVLRGEGRTTYVGELLVRADSDLRDVRQLEGKHIACADPYSLSGFILQAQLLGASGVKAQYDFAVGGHPGALARLRAGSVDAAAVYAGTAGDAADVRVLARTETVPNEPVAVRAGLSPALRALVMRSLRELADTAEGRALLARVGGVTGFGPTRDTDYVPVRRIIATSGKSIEDLVPGGWVIFRRNRAKFFVD